MVVVKRINVRPVRKGDRVPREVFEIAGATTGRVFIKKPNFSEVSRAEQRQQQ